MKETGIKVTKEQSRHFNSIAEHVQNHAAQIDYDMEVCASADWYGYDRVLVEGKIRDLQQNIKNIQQVLDDMLPTLWEQ